MKKFKFNSGFLQTNHVLNAQTGQDPLKKAQHRIDEAIQESANEYVEEFEEEIIRQEAVDVNKEDIDLDQVAAELEEDPEGRLCY